MKYDLEKLRMEALAGGGPFGIFVQPEIVLALLDIAEAARAASYTFMPPLPNKPVAEWYRVMDRMVALTEQFENYGDVPKRARTYRRDKA